MDNKKKQSSKVSSQEGVHDAQSEPFQAYKNKILKEIEMLNASKNKNYFYEYKPDERKVICRFQFDKSKIIVSLDLSNNYPFCPPKLDIDCPDRVGLIELSNINIEEFIQTKWDTSFTFEEIVGKIEKYLSEKTVKKGSKFQLVSFFNEYKATNLKLLSLLLLISISIILRFGIGLAGYSGVKNSPDYGDYEVHRHWMELAISLNPSDYYNVTKEENINYKHFDYPPFCAYVHYVLGKMLNFIEPDATAFAKSKGYESDKLKLFMRWAIILLDITFYMSSLILFIRYTFYKLNFGIRQCILFLLINMPILLLIDHGHFQPNCVMLGLMTFCFYATIKHENAIATILFVLSVNFKLFSAYFFIPIALYILHNIITFSYNSIFKDNKIKSKDQKVIPIIFFFLKITFHIFKLACIGILVLCILFYPWIANKGVNQALAMIFPVERGLFEDKVANVWCFLNTFIKLREKFSIHSLSIISGFVTIVMSFISIFPGLKNMNPNTFLLMLFNVSMIFFLCSYMVHEKTILIPLLPFGLAFFNFKRFHTIINLVALFSNFFLLRRDECTIPYFAIFFGYSIIGFSFEDSLNSLFHFLESTNCQKIEGTKFKLAMNFIYKTIDQNFKKINLFIFGFILIFHVVEAIVPSPSRFPDIYLFICTNLSFIVFCFATFYSWLQLYLYTSNANVHDYSFNQEIIVKEKVN